jgi:DHA1 family tetracycline resistance protein-like MFS transporter
MPLERPQTTRGALSLVFFIMLMDVIGFMILTPVAPYIVQRYSPEALMVTMITVLYAGGQFVAAPIIGKVGDRVGRRLVLLISLVGQGIGYLVFGLGGSLWVLFLGRLISGITAGNFSTAYAYIADVSRPEERTKNFALVGAAWSLGVVLGPAVGGIFAQFSLEAPAYAAAALSFLNVLLCVLILPESLPKEKRSASPMLLRDYNPIVSILDMAFKPGLGWLLIILSIYNFAFNGINSIVAIFVIQKFAAQPWQLSLLTVFAGIALTVVQFLLIQPLVARKGEKTVAVASLLGQSAGNLGIFAAPLFWMVCPLNMFTNALSGFTFATVSKLSTDRVPDNEVGMLMGVTTALGSLMGIFGPLWAGVVYDQVAMGTPYWMSAILYILAAAMLARIRPISVQN